MKGTKYRARGGGMKGTKMRAMGGSMKGTKGMAKGGAAARERAATGMSNMPASVMKALMGEGTRAAGQTPALRGTKGMAKGGAMKGTKGMAKGGAMKGTKGKAKGGAMKGTKGMAKGGVLAARANPKAATRASKTATLKNPRTRRRRKPSNVSGALGKLFTPQRSDLKKRLKKIAKTKK
jgi:hypothetical protein